MIYQFYLIPQTLLSRKGNGRFNTIHNYANSFFQKIPVFVLFSLSSSSYLLPYAQNLNSLHYFQGPRSSTYCCNWFATHGTDWRCYSSSGWYNKCSNSWSGMELCSIPHFICYSLLWLLFYIQVFSLWIVGSIIKTSKQKLYAMPPWKILINTHFDQLCGRYRMQACIPLEAHSLFAILMLSITHYRSNKVLGNWVSINILDLGRPFHINFFHNRVFLLMKIKGGHSRMDALLNLDVKGWGISQIFCLISWQRTW